MIIKDKAGMQYLVWSINKKEILSTNKISCSEIICGKSKCDGCIFALEINGSYNRELSDFEIVKN